MAETFEEASRDAPEVRALFEAYVRELDEPLGEAAETEADIAAGPPLELGRPGGVLLLVRIDGEPAGLGGVRYLDTPAAEIKSMFVAPAFRGTGLGRRILQGLEGIAAEHGCRAVRLDTSSYLHGAIGLYRSAGYTEVEDYNCNEKADLWFERPL